MVSVVAANPIWGLNTKDITWTVQNTANWQALFDYQKHRGTRHVHTPPPASGTGQVPPSAQVQPNCSGNLRWATNACSKVELRTAELLDARSAFDLLRNTRQHGSVRVRIQERFDATKVNALMKFHHDFFDRPNGGTEARSVGQITSDALTAEAGDLTLLLDQAGRYAFLEPFRPIVGKLNALEEKDYTYLLNHLNDFQDDLLTAKEDVLSPIKAFMRGAQRVAYDESITFLREEEANFAEVPAIEVQPRRDLAASAHPYRGNGVPKAKAAVSKLRAILADLLKAERDRALAAVDIQHARLQVVEDFALLNESSRAQVLALTVEARAASNPPALSPAFGTGSNAISHRIMQPSLLWLRGSRRRCRSPLESLAIKLLLPRHQSTTLRPAVCGRNVIFPTSH